MVTGSISSRALDRQLGASRTHRANIVVATWIKAAIMVALLVACAYGSVFVQAELMQSGVPLESAPG